MTRPAGVLTVPFGVVDVCQAGTSLTQPQSNLTVPPMFGSKTWWPSPRSSMSSLASSTIASRSEEHTSELQSRQYLVCRLLLEKKKDTVTSDNFLLSPLR